MNASESTRFAIKAFGFGLMLWIPLLGPLGWLLTGVAWLSPLVVFVAVPLLDFLIGDDRTNEAGSNGKRWAVYHDLVPHAYVMIWLACLVWTALLLTSDRLAVGERIGLMVAAGVASGFATCAAHELLHRSRWADQSMARLTMAMCCYGHFVVEHLHHHAHAGRFEQGTVPGTGESLYAFIARNVAFGARNAYRLGEAIRRRRGLRWSRNRVVQQHALSLALGSLWTVGFGWTGLLLFLFQALIAIATVELVQYFEHYGLVRQGAEALSARHSWNSNGWLTNAITLNIARHSDHHLDARTPYQALQIVEQAPRMPLGYFGLTWLAVVTPVWRSFMGSRLQAGVE